MQNTIASGHDWVPDFMPQKVCLDTFKRSSDTLADAIVERTQSSLARHKLATKPLPQFTNTVATMQYLNQTIWWSGIV